MITSAIKRATEAVKALAAKLKNAIKAALNLLGKALTGLMDLYQKAISAVVNAVKNAVKAAIDFAKAAIAAIGEFASLIVDIAGNPGAWLSNLGKGIVEGIKNHLWAALKGAIQSWFHGKVDGVLGLGQMIWQVLTKGGISLAQVGKMAWEALKQAIPMALVQILIEKLVSMIVPAAGAIMAIIEGLQAAWATASRILQAMQRFIAFLKAVKSGNAGPAFAQALAAGAVAVIDFVSNWLLSKLKGAASKVGSKIKEIAQKILARLKSVASKVWGKVKQGAGKVVKAIANSRAGKAVGNLVNKGKARYQQWKQKREDKKNAGKTPQQIEQEKQQRLDKAVAAIQPKVAALLRWGVPKLVLKGALAAMRVAYRLTSLGLANEDAEETQLVAKVNPEAYVTKVIEENKEAILRIVHEVGRQALKTRGVARQVRSAREQRTAGAGAKDDPISSTRAPATWPPSGTCARPWANGIAARCSTSGWGDLDVATAEKQGTALRLGNIEVKGGLAAIRKSPRCWRSSRATPAPQIARSRRACGWSRKAANCPSRSPVAECGRPPRHLSALHRLLIVEGARGDAAISFGPMLMDMVGKGQMDFKTAFDRSRSSKGGGGAFPPSQVGAVRGMRRVALTEGIDQPLPEEGLTSADRLDTERQMQRQLDFIAEWISMQMKAKHVKFQNEDGARAYITKEFEAALRSSIAKFYGANK